LVETLTIEERDGKATLFATRPNYTAKEHDDMFPIRRGTRSQAQAGRLLTEHDSDLGQELKWIGHSKL